MTLATCSPVALVDSASPNLRLCFQSRRILSAVLTDDLVRSRAEERVDVLAENPLAQERYFKGRSSMHINTNCDYGTDDLFVYSHKTDLVALVLTSGAPFNQTSKNPTTGGASLHKYELVLSRNIGTRTLPKLLLQAQVEDAKAAGVEVLHFKRETEVPSAIFTRTTTMRLKRLRTSTWKMLLTAKLHFRKTALSYSILLSHS